MGGRPHSDIRDALGVHRNYFSPFLFAPSSSPPHPHRRGARGTLIPIGFFNTRRPPPPYASPGHSGNFERLEHPYAFRMRPLQLGRLIAHGQEGSRKAGGHGGPRGVGWGGGPGGQRRRRYHALCLEGGWPLERPPLGRPLERPAPTRIYQTSQGGSLSPDSDNT